MKCPIKRMILTLCVITVTLVVNARAAEDTNRFILPYLVREALFDHTRPRLYVLPWGVSALDVVDLDTRVTTRFTNDHFAQSMAISPDGKRLYVGMERALTMGTIAIYDLENLTFLRQFHILISPWDIVATDSGLVIVSGDNDPSGRLRIYESLFGSQVGSSSIYTPRMRLALHPSQAIVYAADRYPGNYRHYAFSSAGVITATWQAAMSQPHVAESDLFVLPNGSRILAGNGQFLTSTTNEFTDLRSDGTISLYPVSSVAFVTNQNLVVAVSAQQVRYYDYATDQVRETRSVPNARHVGVYGDRTAVLLANPFGLPESEIRFLLPKPTSAAENLPPTVMIQHYEDGTIAPVDSYLAMSVEGRDPDGDIETLRIFSGTNQIYLAGRRDVAFESVPIRPGTNIFYAVVEDSFGAAATSEVRRIFGNHLPTLFLGPLSTTYPSVQTVTLRANASDLDGTVKHVTFLVNDRVVAVDESEPYEFNFTPPIAGRYSYQARAEDNLGGIKTSPSRTVTFYGPVDHFASGMLLLEGTNLTLTGSNLNATRQKGEPLHAGVAGGKSIWWSWKIPSHLAASGGILTIDTLGSDFDTLLAVYSGGPQGTNDITKLKLLAENDDDITHPPTSHVKFFVAGNDILYIAVDGREGVAGNVNLRLHFSPVATVQNDNFETAPQIAIFESRTASNIGATKQPGELPHAGNAGGASVWWFIRTGVDSAPIRISTARSTFDTLLAVYTTNQSPRTFTGQLTNLVLVAANDDANVNLRTSQLTFIPPKPGIYWIAVDGYNGAQGSISLEVTALASLPPASDSFGSAVSLAGNSVLTNGHNTRATLQPGEPHHAGKTDSAASVWYKWTAPTNGLVSLTTRGSDFDTVLAVYTGTNVTSLTAVASNDDDPASPPTSALIFNATAGVQYHIAVAGYGTARGEFVLALNQTPGYSPRILSQWIQGKLWLSATNTLGTTLLEGSTNLVDWQIVQTVSNPQGVEITPAANRPQQFYRLRLLE